ncbi:tubulin-like doman-containing protein [Leptolyngbya sp. FACHB-261]|uniref:tubulin-like doman-containing protein n=1 Tax=Leptolyngbya sp. FACHB-261 TaxID=2692806 RepID=UPI001682129B|nr:tubulin-like doman-containing protein [Leptolyngbya sp. FACHB-261]MBD2101772.1 tubulin-like doman-containing protein [Leptolyngbya sp. FACHB-261]
MTPTVIIGVGGTGKEILVKVRRMIVELYGSLDALPIVSFLHIDTEQNAKVSEPQVVLKQDISLRPAEQVWAKVEDAKAILNKLSSYEYLTEWFPSQLKGTDSILAGAGQIRALGRFAFSLNYQAIKTSFNNAKARIVGHEKFMLDHWQVQLDKGINIFVVCSLSGGTGSGMVLDLAYNLRDWVPPSELPQSSAYLVLPGAFSGLGDRVIANAYAALMELNHYSRNNTRFESQYSSNQSDRISAQSGQDVPFNFCYLVGNSNDKVTFPNLSSVLEMVAQNLFLDFSSGFSQYKKLVRDNVRKQWASPDALGYPQSFISFGLSSIQFPVERVLNACASRLAGRLVTWWANPTPAPAAMRDVIKTEILPSLFLAESDHEHQLLDSISLGDNMKPYSKEVADWAAGVRKRRNDLNIPFENIQRFISNEQEKYAPHFNDSDTDPRRWSDYFQKMWDNLNRLIPQKRQELRQTVYKIIEDRFRGPKFARQFLEVLLEVFAEFRSRFDQDRQKNWLPRERSSANALQVLLKQIDDHAKQFLLVNRKNVIEDDFRGIMQALESLFVSKVEVKARSLAIPLLDGLREEIDKLLIDLAAFERVLDILRSQLQDKEQIFVRETGVLTVNGILLYDPKDIEQVYSKTLNGKEDTVCQSISQQVLGDLGLRLFDLYTFDTLRTKGLYERLLNQAIDEFRTGTQLEISTARKFLEQYPTVEQQEAQIKTTFEKCEPFLRLSQEQKRLGWEDRSEKCQTIVGIQGGNKPTDPAVGALLPMIRKTSTLTDKDIRPLNDPHHIYFVQEIGAFPLRLIEGMERMRTIYRAVTHADKNPLHTHQDSRQFKDLMPPTQSEVQVRQNLVLARALGLMTQVENRVSGFSEVRFAYRDKQSGLEKLQVVGADWQEAEEYLLVDQNRKVRETLDDIVNIIGQTAVTKPDKQELYQKLMAHLHVSEASISGGKDSPDYQKLEAAIEDYVKVHSLFIAPALGTATLSSPKSPAALKTPSSASAPSGMLESNLEKFTKLVETCYRRGNPSPTELQLLERFRQKYNISQEVADQITAQVQPKHDHQQAIDEFGLMFRAFLENDGDIDFEEQAQLIELQEELELTNEQVAAIESNVRDELGHK